jgi:hypothetical protein
MEKLELHSWGGGSRLCEAGDLRIFSITYVYMGSMCTPCLNSKHSSDKERKGVTKSNATGPARRGAKKVPLLLLLPSLSRVSLPSSPPPATNTLVVSISLLRHLCLSPPVCLCLLSQGLRGRTNRARSRKHEAASHGDRCFPPYLRSLSIIIPPCLVCVFMVLIEVDRSMWGVCACRRTRRPGWR